jgi:hypothetical protein
MRLTSRGKRVAAAMALLLGAGLIFLDPIMLGGFAVGLALLFYETYDAFSSGRKAGLASLSPNAFEGRILRGNSRRFDSTLSSTRPITFDLSSTSWVHLSATSFPEGTWPLVIELSSDLAGSYSSNGIPAIVNSRLGLISTGTRIPLEARLRVYPRMVAAAIAALDYLTRVGVGTEGEVERNLIGPGLEYAETREFLPGDNLRRVDWRATARSQSLMVKHYYAEGGGALHIIYFVEAPGPRTHDEMATQLVDLVVSSAVRVTPVSVTAYERGKRLASIQGKGWEVVISTLNLVMAEAGVDYDDLYSVLDIVSVSKERRALILAGRNRLAELLRRAGGKRQALVADFRGLIAHLASPDVMSSFIILSSLVSNRDVLAEIVQDLRFKRAETTVVYPKKPWSDAASLTEAYTLQASHERMLAYIGSTGSLVGAIPLKLPRMTGIPSWTVSAAP